MASPSAPARAGRNGVTTQIGDGRFTAFRTSLSKSRTNFLDCLRAGHDDYVVDEAAVAYMRRHHLAGPVIDRLISHPQRSFPDKQAWTAHLEALGITGLEVDARSGEDRLAGRNVGGHPPAWAARWHRRGVR